MSWPSPPLRPPAGISPPPSLLLCFCGRRQDPPLRSGPSLPCPPLSIFTRRSSCLSPGGHFLFFHPLVLAVCANLHLVSFSKQFLSVSPKKLWDQPCAFSSLVKAAVVTTVTMNRCGPLTTRQALAVLLTCLSLLHPHKNLPRSVSLQWSLSYNRSHRYSESLGPLSWSQARTGWNQNYDPGRRLFSDDSPSVSLP